MQEHPLLIAFAQLVGDFFHYNLDLSPLRETLLRRVAQALLQGQIPETVRESFQFERIRNFNTQYLSAEERDMLNRILGEEQAGIQPGQPQIRVFLREMPARAVYLRSSVPAWARAAALTDSVGPILNRDGRRFWMDIYPVLPEVKAIGFINTSRPALILGPDTPLVINTPAVNSLSIGAGTIWVQSAMFAPGTDEKLYSALLVESAEVTFQGGIAQYSHGRIIMRGGTMAILDVRLRTPETIRPEDVPQGADAWAGQFKLPEAFQMRIQPGNSGLLQVADAAWNIYGEDKNFTWTQAAPSFNYLFSAVSIPMRVDTDALNVLQCLSPVFSLAGATVVEESSWLLPAAEINWMLPAEGAGLLSVRTQKGLSATVAGALDINQAGPAQLQINRCWITGTPGQIQVIALESVTEYAVQTLRLWQDQESRWNELQLTYPGTFPFIYQCNAPGTETIVSITNCLGKLDRPVGADKQPFSLKTKTSLYLRTYGALNDYLFLYDENVIRDNEPDTGGPAVPADQLSFQSRALALNNALMTVSPVNAYLLSGELPPQAETFTETSLLYAFALVGYLPALPDPYAANRGVFKWMHHELEGQEGVYRLNQIQRVLIGAMHWQAAEAPGTNFIFGDIADMEANQFIHLNPMLDLQRALNDENNNRNNRTSKTNARFAQQSGMNNQGGNGWPEEYDAFIRVDDRYRNYHFFSLLDVSTAADWMGVDVGYLDEQFIFERRFDVVTAQNPLSADGMDVVAAGKLVRLFTTPQISWEPVLNKSAVMNAANDPPEGLLLFRDDGPPTLIGNTGNDPVPIAPLPAAKYLEEGYRNNDLKAWSFFTLPFGMLGIGRYNQEVTIGALPPSQGARIEILRHTFDGDIETGLQISTTGFLNPVEKNRNFEGMAYQLYNLRGPMGEDLNRSILSGLVTEIFNREFGPNAGKLRQRGVPLERYDFSGYGANVFSHWTNEDAQIAQTSQAKFDVWRGRTAHEVIQVRSLVYPWGIRVVRTITMYRNSAALVYRIDSGWRAESDGVYNFKTTVNDKFGNEQVEPVGYSFHPGIVKGVFNVRNIVESDDLARFGNPSWLKNYGYYIDENDGLAIPVGAGHSLPVDLFPVYFDADVQIDGIVQGGINGRAPSKRMLGYLQLAPRGVPISRELFRDLLLSQNGLGGPVDCLIDIGETGQTMRLTRVEVQPSMDAGQIVFVTAAKGTPVLPKDGSWSVVSAKKATGEVLPISNSVVPLIRRGLHTVANNLNPLELANPADLFNMNLEDRATQYAFLQNTDTQKVLFRNPWFEPGKKFLQCSKPDLADAYRLLNSKGIFPKIGNLPRLDLADFNMNIIEKGYQLDHKAVPGQILEQVLPDGPVYFINEKDIKIYVEYLNKDINNVKKGNGTVNFGLDSAAGTWANKMNDITIFVDLLDMTRLFLIRGKFDTEKGSTPGITSPELEFGKDLQPVVDILRILMDLNGGNYKGALTKGLKVAMSNSPNNWEYKFQADKEIPVLKFPPPIADSPVAPLRLEASLKLGCYFNVGMPYPAGGSPMPSAGGYIEFGAKLSVMCVSLAAATVYAVGNCTMRISADTVRGPGLYLKMGFGVELVVGLPVVGNVSVYFAAGVEISIDTRVIIVGAFILFRGRAELIGGLVTIQIQIEASGKVKREIGPGEDRTYCIAQVTFSLDISIFLVINISFSKTFQEDRQLS